MSEYSIALEKQLEMQRGFAALATVFQSRMAEVERLAQDEPLVRNDVMATYELNRMLSDADTFFVSSSIQRLLVGSAYADGLGDFRLADFTPPSRSGFVYFQDPLVSTADEDGDVYQCFGWNVTMLAVHKDGRRQYATDSTAKTVDPYERLDSGQWRLVNGAAGADVQVAVFALSVKPEIDAKTGLKNYPNYVVDWGSKDSLEEVLRRPKRQNDPVGHVVEERILRLLPTFCAFISQHILSADGRSVDRAAGRRLYRMGIQRDPLVRVVELRRRCSAQYDNSAAKGPVEWACQWLVRGHWRRQWYPTLERHQMRWITPYVKGPEDKPLKQPRATVFAVVR